MTKRKFVQAGRWFLGGLSPGTDWIEGRGKVFSSCRWLCGVYRGGSRAVDFEPLRENRFASLKVDRQALPVSISNRPKLQTAFLAPRTRAEEIIAGIWSEVLSLDEVGVDDNFLDLGGHSLAATQVISRVIKEFQVELPLQVVFQSPTVARMAGVVAGYQA